MKDEIFSVLQRVGRSFMLPVAILPIAGLLLGIGSSFTNANTIKMYGLEGILGNGTVLHALLTIMSSAGNIIFGNLPIIFAVGVAIGMAKAEKEVAALSAMIAFFVMHVSCNAVLQLTGKVLPDGTVAPGVLEGTIANTTGITSLQMGVFGGIIVGIGVAWLHNRYHKIVLPDALSFFGGARFIPIISTIVYLFVGILMYFIWPIAQNAIFSLGGLVTGTGYIGTLIFGIVKRALIPFGLHHVFYLPFWQTGVGGSMMVDGNLIQGGQNIFFAQLASPDVTHFSADATRYFSGEFIFMIFGLPGAALAMYRCARPEKKRIAKGLLLSAALTCMLTGITEPIEFSFLFVAPMLFYVQVVLAGAAYMIAHMLNIAVGLTFSGGLLDLFIFGILQGNDKTSWMYIIPVGIVYFFLYYFIFTFLIKKFNLKTPGREDDDQETKLYMKADVNSRKNKGSINAADTDEMSSLIARALGSRGNITSVDCCATRLRCSVKDSSLVDEKMLKATGAVGVIVKGTGVQVVYGPKVTVIKTNLDTYLQTAPETEPELDVMTSAGSAAKVFEMETKTAVIRQKHALYSPFNGTVHPITEAPDTAFSSKMMGDGYFVYPSDGTVVAPDDGEVVFVFDTKHAIGMKTSDGVEYLLHIGIDTVNLKGQGFEVFVEKGQQVKKGDKLMQFDAAFIREKAASDACLVIFTGLQENEEIHMEKIGEIEALAEVAYLEK
ncbi:PTS transporter subunit IIABC [Pectinatus haikarae]|uniref:PTS system D-glucosamine-specific IIC component n=1 Tax=Pectinatus haikarae TaxID=349096 RepID=A0ABT9Y5I6_9FIRM|nr:PTS transporter subunit IIABC [Pectinatus haikarae]MDQ0202452.1 PTS system D-glucosamine-specific IIC component [Pectinatus haikarae]